MTKITPLVIATAAIAFAGFALLAGPRAALAAETRTLTIDQALEARLDAEMDAELRRLTAAGAADIMCPVDGHGTISYSGTNPEIVGVSEKPAVAQSMPVHETNTQVAETGSHPAK